MREALQKKVPFGLLQITLKDNVLSITTLDKGNSVQELKTKHKKSEYTWQQLLAKDWYQKDVIAKLNKAPGLNKISSKDMREALTWRKELTPLITQYLKNTKNTRPYMVYRFVENYRNKKLVQLGYNPYKQVVYNFSEQFKDDPALVKMLTEPITFD